MKQSLEEKQSLAMEGLAAGKNCGQLVLLAYQEELNLPKEKPLCSCEDCIKEAIALLY